MATTDTPAAIEIASLHDLHAEAAAIQTHFKDKESEFNWEARESSIIRLRAMLHGNASQTWPDDFAHDIRTLTDAILKGLQSLRTTLSLATLALIEDLGRCLGPHLDNYTFDTLLQNLLRCALLSKKLVSAASMTTTITFLTETPFHSKVMSHISALSNDKSIQARQFAFAYACSFAQAHGAKSKGPFEKSGGIDLFSKMIQKGLSDAAPAVRSSAREGFWVFHSLWKDRGDKLLKSLDQASQKQLLRNKPGSANTDPSKLQASRTASSSSIGSNASKRPSLKKSNTSLRSSTSIHSDHSKSKTLIPVAPIAHPRAVSPSVSSTSNTSNDSHISHYSRKPLVASKSSTSKLPTITKSSVASTSSTASQRSLIGKPKQPPTRKPTVTELINSDDDNVRCTGILTVAEKLLETHYSFGKDTHLPTDLPENTVLVPALLVNLQYPRSSACITLMSWDGIAGVIGKICSVEQFVYPLLLSMEREQNNASFHATLNAGFSRWKRLLKKFDDNLGETLLKCFLTTMANRQQMNGSFAVTQMDMSSRHKIATILLEWMDELVCVVVGLSADDVIEDDSETATAWLGENDDLAPVWFEQDQNLRKYLTKLIPILLSTTPTTSQYSPLLQLIGHLRLVHESVFQAILLTLDASVTDRVCHALGISPPLQEKTTSQVSMDYTQFGNISEAAADLLQRTGMDVDHTDVTEDISKISLEHLEQEDPELEAEIATLAVLSAERLMKNGNGTQETAEEPVQIEPSVSETTVTDEMDHPREQEVLHTPDRVKTVLMHTPPSWPRREQEHHDVQDPITVNDSLENSKRHKPAQTSNPSPFSKSNKNRSGLLIPLIERLKSGNPALDEAFFRKLVRLAKDNPIMQRWDQGGNCADGADLWNGDSNDASLFKNLIIATLPYLEQTETHTPHGEDILALYKQLLLCQPGLWKFWSISSREDEGISASTITRLLLKCRSTSTANVLSSVDDTLDTFFFTLDGDVCLKTLLEILALELDEQPVSEPQDSWTITHHHPITSAFSYLTKIAPRCNPGTADQYLADGGKLVLVKGCNYPQVSARKACVDSIVSLNQLIPGGVIRYLDDLRDDQMRLVQHYITKAQNKPLHRDFSSMQRLYSS
ncbi:clasp N terminal-domain-containing protein [Umbelopsis sp. AD052]|nr:clasp N terminal-domain-containing protein [Umbelopsis sp. AD052]